MRLRQKRPRHPRSAPIQRYAWVVLGVVYLASVGAPLIQNKVPPDHAGDHGGVSRSTSARPGC